MYVLSAVVGYREQVGQEKQRAYLREYWGKPVPEFGNPEALRIIAGRWGEWIESHGGSPRFGFLPVVYKLLLPYLSWFRKVGTTDPEPALKDRSLADPAA